MVVKMMTIEAHANGKVSHNLDTIFKELSTLRAENRRMREKLTIKARGSKIVRRALVDAHTIMMAAFSGENTGRKAMSDDHGMTKHRWAWGVAFLRYAGIVSFRSKHWRNGLDFVVTDLADAVRLLETAATELVRADGYRRLRQVVRKV